MGTRAAGFAAALAAVLTFAATAAHAAGGGYAVDDSEIGKPGDCKIESWISIASNGDRTFNTVPACVVSLWQPVEISGQLARARASGAWSSTFQLQAKTTLRSVEKGQVGIGFAAGGTFGLTTGQPSNAYFYVPVTLQLSETFRLNLNGGGQFQQAAPGNTATWGVGFEWTVLKNGLTVILIGEMFGQSVGTPGSQLGLRFTPHEKFDIDLIYGRNLAGEHANWFTLGLNLRF